MTNTTKKGMWKRTFGLFRHIRIPWPLYLLEVALSIVSTRVALLYIPYQSALQTGNIEDPATVWGYIGFLLLSASVLVISAVPSFFATAIVCRNLQSKLVDHSIRLPMRSFESKASQIVSWITQDCSYADGLITAVIGFITGAVSTYMSITSMSAIDISMISIVPIIAVYIIFSTWVEGRCMFLREKRARLATGELTAYLSEHMSFFTQIKQLHSQKEEEERGKKAIIAYYKAEIYQAVITLLNNFVSGSISSVITILVFVLGVPKVNSGEITLADLATFQSYILLAYQSLSSIPGLYTNFMYYNGTLFYISSLMAEKEEVYKRERTMDIEDRSIRFENVSFAYDEEQPLITDVSFTIPKGKVTMIAGPNGSGKTTLFKLIERFYTPDSGKIYFGEIEAEKIHLDEWRKSMSYVLQEPQLFNASIRDNINYGLDREVSEEETMSAAKLACADEFIKEFPEGLDFVIGENGSRLSAGQRQRIAIARAVMIDPAYLLLDEATCNMDIYSEKKVSEALMNLMKGRTTVMISHDMDTLKHADHVVVINGGKIEAEGTPDEAANNSETLRKLIEAGEIE